MSAVSMKFTPNSTARRRTRTPAARSSTMRIAPKPTRRTSSSPPSMNVGFTRESLLVQRGEDARRDAQVPRRRRELRIAGDVDAVAAGSEPERRAEVAPRVELRPGDDAPAARDVARHGDGSARTRHDLARELHARDEPRTHDRRDRHADLGPTHTPGGEPVD